MSNEAYKAWLDSMPIDDVRHKIERLEQKLADTRVLERLYSERRAESPAQHGESSSGESPAPAGVEAESPAPASGGEEPAEWGASEGT